MLMPVSRRNSSPPSPLSLPWRPVMLQRVVRGRRLNVAWPHHPPSIQAAFSTTCHCVAAVLPESSTSSIPDELEAEIDTGLKERLDVCNKFAGRQLQVGLVRKAYKHFARWWGECTVKAG